VSSSINSNPIQRFILFSARSAEFNQLRILPIVSPHPVQPNSEFSGHGHFGKFFPPGASWLEIAGVECQAQP
jgi:hypothetical protein